MRSSTIACGTAIALKRNVLPTLRAGNLKCDGRYRLGRGRDTVTGAERMLIPRKSVAFATKVYVATVVVVGKRFALSVGAVWGALC